MNRSIWAVIAAVFAGAAVLAHSVGASPSDAPPPLPADSAASASDADSDLAPEITIKDKGDTTVEEYRLNGQLYMIKIIPKKGLPYYLVDSDGSGRFDKRVDDKAPRLLIPSWVILKFR